MNEITHFLFIIYNFNLLIRDTLEYTIQDRKEFKIQLYNHRKDNLTAILNGPSPVRHFLDSNKETGKKIDEQLREFIEEVYSDKSTIIRVSGEELRVDSAQHLAIYNFVVGLHETFSDIINGYIAHIQKEDVTFSFKKMIEDDDFMYRAIAYMNIIADVEKTFIEFNQAMRETQGKPSPQSNFIINDLRRYFGFLKFVKEHYKNGEFELKSMFESVEKLIAYMEGREKLPEGKTFPQVFEETKAITKQVVAKAEQKWRTSFAVVYQEVVEFEKKRAEQEQ